MMNNSEQMKSLDKISDFDVVMGLDMETDIGSFTSFYEGVQHGTPHILNIFKRYKIRGTFYWTGHAAENNPEMVNRVKDDGHEIGCHSLFHETVGDALFPLPNNWPILPSEVEGRLTKATEIIHRVCGVRPKGFRSPRLWGSTQVVKVLEKLDYNSDASLPLYFYNRPITPYRPSRGNWTEVGNMNLIEIPNFCDLSMESKDPYQRDRDQWPLFRTKSTEALMKKVDSFIQYVSERGERPVLCFYFHPWEFYPMTQEAIDYGEASVKPLPFIVKNCGEIAVQEFDKLCKILLERGGDFKTAEEIALMYLGK